VSTLATADEGSKMAPAPEPIAIAALEMKSRRLLKRVVVEELVGIRDDGAKAFPPSNRARARKVA